MGPVGQEWHRFGEHCGVRRNCGNGLLHNPRKMFDLKKLLSPERHNCREFDLLS